MLFFGASNKYLYIWSIIILSIFFLGLFFENLRYIQMPDNFTFLLGLRVPIKKKDLF